MLALLLTSLALSQAPDPYTRAPVLIGASGASSPTFAPSGIPATGVRVNVEFQQADIHTVLRFLADAGKLNLVVADGVSGTVTVRMTNVPVEDALQAILAAKGLALVPSGASYVVQPLSPSAPR